MERNRENRSNIEDDVFQVIIATVFQVTQEHILLKYEMDWSQQTDHGGQSQRTWGCCDIHNSMQQAEELHFWKDFHKVSILGRELVNSIFERIFMNSVTEILSKGKKEKPNSTVSGDHCGILRALKAARKKQKW